MDQLIDWDQRLFLWLNGFHSPWLDPVMYVATSTVFWIPLYLFLLFLIFKNYKKEGWLILAGVAIAILIADRVTTGFMKPYFHRLRPSQDPHLAGMVHIVSGYKGGLYAFASSHAANTVATAYLIWLIFKRTYKWIWLMFLWAALMCYTRIYLGVHYPGDILAGGVIGLLAAWLGYLFYKWLAQKFMKPPITSG